MRKKNSKERATPIIWIWTYNKRDFLASKHKITLDELNAVKINQANILNKYSSLRLRNSVGPVGWRCRLHWLLFCNECPGYDNKQSDNEVSVILELWGMKNTPSLPSLPGLLWPREVAPDRVLSMGQRKLNYVITLNWIVWNRTVWSFNFV